jgi:hypothetical protein
MSIITIIIITIIFIITIIITIMYDIVTVKKLSRKIRYVQVYCSIQVI